MKQLIVYPNASKGGITSVIRGRAAAEPNVRFDVLFFNDRGGSQAFADLKNVRTAILPKGRAEFAAKYLHSQNSYDTISILSAPSMMKHLADVSAHVRYEFHSSDMSVNKREIDALELGSIDELSVPSNFMASAIQHIIPAQFRKKLSVTPNLVDGTIFSAEGTTDFYRDLPSERSSSNAIPLVWVGRFDEGKGYRHFLRALGMLPSKYYGVVVVSLEKDPSRASAFLNEAAVAGVFDRVELYLNQSQFEMAKLYRWAAQRGGRAVSTSLLESFGYFVAESAACGLPVVAFNLPVWKEHENQNKISTVPVGSVTELVRAIQRS